MNIEDFTPKQVEEAKTCKTPKELLALAQAKGVQEGSQPEF